MTRIVSDEEQLALDAAREQYVRNERERREREDAERARFERRHRAIQAAVWIVIGVFAVTVAALAGFYLRGAR